MERNYKSGVQDDVQFFVGTEIEHTPAYGMRTLFVTGVQDVKTIEHLLKEENSYIDKSRHIKHIFFGANHSFNPAGLSEYQGWEDMIVYFLKKGYWCSLDIPLNQVLEFNDGGLNEYNQFIPQIRVPIAYTKLWNYNTMLKIDDIGFNKTNPGVWTHSLHKLMDRDCFTSWDQYSNDEIIA